MAERLPAGYRPGHRSFDVRLTRETQVRTARCNSSAAPQSVPERRIGSPDDDSIARAHSLLAIVHEAAWEPLTRSRRLVANAAARSRSWSLGRRLLIPPMNQKGPTVSNPRQEDETITSKPLDPSRFRKPRALVALTGSVERTDHLTGHMVDLPARVVIEE